MIGCLGANVHVSIDDFHISPRARDSLSGQTTDILELPSLVYLDESGAVSLANSAEFAPVRGSPTLSCVNTACPCLRSDLLTPDIIAFLGGRAHLLMAEEGE